MVIAAVSVETLSDYLQRKMKQRGMKTRMLAIQSGVPESTLRPLVTGRTENPDLRTLLRLAEPLKVSYEALARVAVGLPEFREEPAPENAPLKQRLDVILDALDPEQLRLAERLLREIAQWGREDKEEGTQEA